jgi:hypothetical protein
LIPRLCVAFTLLLASGFGLQTAPPPTYVLSGIVVDSETHDPLPETEVQVAPAGKTELVESVITNANGRFTFDNLFAGTYTLTAARPGYLESHYQQHGRYSTAIQMGPGLQSTDLVFPLAKKASISGTIVDRDGEPVPYANVEALRQSVVDGLRCVTLAGSAGAGEDGRYRVANLRSGTYFLVVMAQPWYTQQYMAMEKGVDRAAEASSKLDAAYPVTYYPGVSSDSAAAPIVLRAGAQAQADFTLTEVPAIHVIVPRSAGANTNARLLAANHWGASLSLRSMYFSRLGQIFNLAPGRYQLLAGWRDAAGEHSAAKIMEIDGDLTIDPATLDNRRSVVASLSEAGAAMQLPSSGLALRDLSTLRTLNPVRAGNKQVRWPAQELISNRYELIWNGSGDFYVQGVAAVNAKVTGRIVEFGPDAPVQLQVRLARGDSLVKGKVQHGGTPVPGAMVLLLRDDFATAPSLIRRDQSNSDGSFSLDNVVPGSYTLLALPTDDDLAYADPSAIDQFLSKGKRLSIAPFNRYSETIDF